MSLSDSVSDFSTNVVILPLSSFGGCAGVRRSCLHFLCDMSKVVVQEVDTEVSEGNFAGPEGWQPPRWFFHSQLELWWPWVCLSFFQTSLKDYIIRLLARTTILSEDIKMASFFFRSLFVLHCCIFSPFLRFLSMSACSSCRTVSSCWLFRTSSCEIQVLWPLRTASFFSASGFEFSHLETVSFCFIMFNVEWWWRLACQFLKMVQSNSTKQASPTRLVSWQWAMCCWFTFVGGEPYFLSRRKTASCWSRTMTNFPASPLTTISSSCICSCCPAVGSCGSRNLSPIWWEHRA